MFKIAHGVKGYISLVLCVILLPMMTYSTMIIDASRLQSLRTGIQSAGDLALNAALSEYDFLLEDMYGLFANTDEAGVEDAVKLYFTQTIQNTLADYSFDQNKTEACVDAIYDYFYSTFMNGEKIDEDDVTNFITAQMESFSLDGVTGSALANPAVMKQQIIEYMKYKAPVSIITSLVGKIKAIAESTEQLNACASQVEYEKEIKNLEKDAIDAYESMDAEYNQLAQIFNQLIKDDGSSRSMNAMLEDAKKMIEVGLAFYLLSDTSPFSGNNSKPVYADYYSAAQADSGITEISHIDERYSYLRDFETYIDYLYEYDDAIIGTRSNLDTLGAQINDIVSKVNQDIGECSYNDEVSDGNATVERIRGIVDNVVCNFPGFTYNLDVRNQSSVNKDTIPSYEALVGADATWFTAFRATSDRNTPAIYQDEINDHLQLDFLGNIIEEQKKFATREDGIRELIKYRMKLEKLSNALFDELGYYKQDLENYFLVHHCEKLEYYDEEGNLDHTEVRLQTNDPNDGSEPYVDFYALSDEWRNYLNSEYVAYYQLWRKADAYREYLQTIENNIKGDKGYIHVATHAHTKCDEYGKPYFQDGIYSLASIKYLLDSAKKALDNAASAMENVVSTLNSMADIKEEWDGHLDKVDSDTAKVSLKQSQDSVVNIYNLEDAENLKRLVADMSGEIELKRDQVNAYSVLGTTLAEMLGTVSKAPPCPSASDSTDGIFYDRFEHYVKNQDGTENVAMIAVKRATKEMRSAFSFKPKSAYRTAIINYESMANRVRLLKNYPSKDNQIFEQIHNGETALERSINLIGSNDNFKHENYAGAFAPLRLLDGIIEDAGENTPTGESIAQNSESTPEARRKNDAFANNAQNGGGNTDDDDSEPLPDVIDEQEKFVMTLYSIWQSAEMAKGETKKRKTTEESDETYDSLKTAANESSDTQKDNKGGDDDADNKKKKENPATEVYGDVMKNIEAYVGQADAITEATKTVSADVPIGEGEDSEGENAKNWDPGSSVGDAASSIGDMFGNLLGSIAETAYLEEYFTEMFSCRTDALEKDGRDPVVYLSGYSSDEHATKRINTNTEWFGHETEYILWGKPDLATNYLDTDALLFTIRFGLNVLYAFTTSDIRNFAQLLATSVCIGPAAVAIPVVKTCIIIALAIAESGVDLWLLHNGEDVAIYKTKRTFVCSPNGFSARMKGSLREVAKEQADKLIKSATELAEEKLGELVDDVNTKMQAGAAVKIEDIEDKLNGTINTYMGYDPDNPDEGYTIVNEVIDKANDLICQPVLDALTKFQGQLMAAAQYQPVEVLQSLARQTIEDALAQAESYIDTLPDSVVKTLAKQVLADNVANGANSLVDEMLNLVIEKFNLNSAADVVNLLNDKTSDLMEKIEELREEVRKTVTDKLDQLRETAEGLIKKAGDAVMGEIKTVGDQSATNIKEFANKKLDSLGDAIGTKVSSSLDAIPDADDNMKRENEIYDAADDQTEAGAVTLNYKEYIKIFMLIRLAAGDQNKLLKRAAVMIQCNMRHPIGGDNLEFDICKANTLFSVSAVMKMKTLFPWCADSNTDGLTGESSLDFHLPKMGGNNFMHINYCGVNGY